MDMHQRKLNFRMLKLARLNTDDQGEPLSLLETSRRSGLSVSYISKVENGEKGNAFLLTLQKLAKAYGGYIDLRLLKFDDHGVRTYYDLLE